MRGLDDFLIVVLFVSVSQTPDLKKLFKGLLYDLGNSINDEILDENRLISLLREFLKSKRYGRIYAMINM